MNLDDFTPEEVAILTRALGKLIESQMNSHAQNPKLGFREAAAAAERLSEKIFGLEVVNKCKGKGN